MSEKETPEERARSQAYAAGAEAERHHTARAVVERDAARRELAAIQRLHLDALEQLAAVHRAYDQQVRLLCEAHAAAIQHVRDDRDDAERALAELREAQAGARPRMVGADRVVVDEDDPA